MQIGSTLAGGTVATGGTERMIGSSTGLAVETCERRLRLVDPALPGAVGVDGHLSWFGRAGIAAGRPGSEAAVQALSGLMEVNGRDGGRPRRLGLDVASVAAGLLGASGVLAAAVARRRGHDVTAVATSPLEAALVLMSHYFVVATGLGDAVPGPPLAEPGPPFRSAEGTWFEIETLDPEDWRRFWGLLGVEGPELGRAWTVFRWRYERAACSLPAGLHEATARRPLAELADAAAAAGVSLSPLRAYADVLADPGQGAAAPEVRRAGPGDPSPAAAATGTTGAGPLAGLRVVEATTRIQGPFAGMLLRMLGADVVRVQPPEGDYGRAALCLHRGKETVRLDLATPAGRDELAGLVDGADVFFHNWRPGKAEAWGLDVGSLTRRNRRLVYGSASGWGARRVGQGLVGTDFLVQAYAGLGGTLHPEGEAPFPSRVILGDLFGAIVLAEGVLAGLYRREHEPGAWEVRSSLLAGVMALQAHVLDAVAEGKSDGRPRWGPLDRPIPTADGSLVVTVDDDDAFRDLCRVCDVDPTAASRSATEERLAARLADGRADEWVDACTAAGLPSAVAVEDLATVPADPRFAGLFEPVGMGGLAPSTPWTFS